MQAEEQHRGREQAGIVDAHRIHPCLGHGDVAMGVGRRLFQLPQVVAGNAAANVLVSDLAVHHRGAAAALGRFHRGAPDHWAVDVGKHLLIGFVLVVVRVDVDDEEVGVIVPARLLGRVLEIFRRRILVEARRSDLVARHIHGGSFHATTKMSSPRRTTSYLRRCAGRPARSRWCKSTTMKE
jgi:hypothetical protein